MKLITSAITYKCVMPQLATNMTTELEKLPFVELAPTDFCGAGFVEPIEHEGLALSFNGGYAFALRYDEKIIPGSVVTAETKKRAAELEEQQGFKVGCKQLRELKEFTYATLLPRALTRSRIVTCFYLTAHRLLIVPTTSESLANRVTNQLVKAMGAKKATTIYVSTAKGSLTNRLTEYLGGQVDAFDGFSVGSKVKLVGLSGEKFALELNDGLHRRPEGMNEAIISGSQVTEIELVADGVVFRLTSKFRLKGVHFPDGSAEPQEFGSVLEQWEHEAAIQTSLVSTAINDLCDLLGYKEGAENMESNPADTSSTEVQTAGA